MMTKARCLAELKDIAEWSGAGGYDPEAAHDRATGVLLSYIGDEEITAAYGRIDRL